MNVQIASCLLKKLWLVDCITYLVFALSFFRFEYILRMFVFNEHCQKRARKFKFLAQLNQTKNLKSLIIHSCEEEYDV